jgi:hypothetical protein
MNKQDYVLAKQTGKVFTTFPKTSLIYNEIDDELNDEIEDFANLIRARRNT